MQTSASHHQRHRRVTDRRRRGASKCCIRSQPSDRRDASRVKRTKSASTITRKSDQRCGRFKTHGRVGGAGVDVSGRFGKSDLCQDQLHRCKICTTDCAPLRQHRPDNRTHTRPHCFSQTRVAHSGRLNRMEPNWLLIIDPGSEHSVIIDGCLERWPRH